jgi:hypothetical protein
MGSAHFDKVPADCRASCQIAMHSALTVTLSSWLANSTGWKTVAEALSTDITGSHAAEALSTYCSRGTMIQCRGPSADGVSRHEGQFVGAVSHNA